MRFILHLLALVALLSAPLAAPTAAIATVAQSQIDCDEMAMAAPEHDMPTSEHRTGEACCIAVPAAINPPLAVLGIATPIDHLAFVAGIEPFRLGAGPKAEDPPPRIA